MDYDALIYHENIYDTYDTFHKFYIPHLCMHLSYACVQRWHDVL